MKAASDPYREFLAEQKKREAEWLETTKAKKARTAEKETKSSSYKAALATDVTEIELKLDAKTCECALLKDQLLVQESL